MWEQSRWRLLNLSSLFLLVPGDQRQPARSLHHRRLDQMAEEVKNEQKLTKKWGSLFLDPACAYLRKA